MPDEPCKRSRSWWTRAWLAAAASRSSHIGLATECSNPSPNRGTRRSAYCRELPNGRPEGPGEGGPERNRKARTQAKRTKPSMPTIHAWRPPRYAQVSRLVRRPWLAERSIQFLVTDVDAWLIGWPIVGIDRRLDHIRVGTSGHRIRDREFL